MAGMPPDWPKKYPCVAVVPHNGPSETPGQQLVLVPGTQAVVWSLHATDCRITTIQPPQLTGLVPYSSLRIGTTREYLDFEIETRLPVIGPLTNTPLPEELSGLRGTFARTVHTLVQEMHAHSRGLLHFLPFWFKSLTPQQLIDAASRIVEGTRRANLLDVFGSPTFTNADMRSAGVSASGTSAQRDHRTGIYCRDYWSFQDDVMRRALIYIGKALDFYKRYLGHENSMKKETPSTHYNAAKLANSRKQYAICILGDTEDELRTLAEQVFVLLLQTNNSYIMGATQSKTAEDATRRYASIQEAHCLHHVARQVFSRTGWQGGCQRESFGTAPFGLNGTNPMTEGPGTTVNERTIWTKLTVPGEIAIYRRTKHSTAERLEIGAQGILKYLHAGELIYYEGGKAFNFNFQLPIDKGPEAGTNIYMIFEHMINGQPHEVPWARLPTVGPFKNWNEINSLAISFEWQAPDGNWRKTYIQSAGRRKSLNTNAPGSLPSYADALSFIRFLTRQIISSKPDWLKLYGLARVKEIKLDHLTQRLTFEDMVGSQIAIDGNPERKSKNEIVAELKAVGLQSVDAPWYFARDTCGRTVCDRCHLNGFGGSSHSIKACKRVSSSDVCNNCADFGIPCSWTRTNVLNANPKMKAALMMVPNHSDAALMDIPDPQLNTAYAGRH